MGDEMFEPWRVWDPVDRSNAPWTGAIAIVVDDYSPPEYPATTICWFTRGWDADDPEHPARKICEWHNRQDYVRVVA